MHALKLLGLTVLSCLEELYRLEMFDRLLLPTVRDHEYEETNSVHYRASLSIVAIRLFLGYLCLEQLSTAIGAFVHRKTTTDWLYLYHTIAVLVFATVSRYAVNNPIIVAIVSLFVCRRYLLSVVSHRCWANTIDQCVMLLATLFAVLLRRNQHLRDHILVWPTFLILGLALILMLLALCYLRPAVTIAASSVVDFHATTTTTPKTHACLTAYYHIAAKLTLMTLLMWSSVLAYPANVHVYLPAAVAATAVGASASYYLEMLVTAANRYTLLRSDYYLPFHYATAAAICLACSVNKGSRSWLRHNLQWLLLLSAGLLFCTGLMFFLRQPNNALIQVFAFTVLGGLQEALRSIEPHPYYCDTLVWSVWLFTIALIALLAIQTAVLPVLWMTPFTLACIATVLGCLPYKPSGKSIIINSNHAAFTATSSPL